jgi:Flp pilus assembly protein TadD
MADALRAKGETVGAASAYQKLAAADPRSPAPRVGLASTYLSMGDLDAAGREAAEAVRLSPKDPDALYWAGKVSEAKGDSSSARRFYQSALEMRPIGDKVLSVPYTEMVRAVSSTSSKGSTSFGKDVR